MTKAGLAVLGIASALALALVAAIVGVGLGIGYERRALDTAYETAHRRPEARVIKSVGLPDVNGKMTDWIRMVPLGGKALVLGKRERAGEPVLLMLDPIGAAEAPVDLQTEHCGDVAMVATGRDTAMVLCATDGQIASFWVASDGAKLNVTKLPDRRVSGGCSQPCEVFAAVHGTHHFWIVPSGADRWAIAAGEGATAPLFSPIAQVSSVSDVVGYSDDEVLVAFVESNGDVRLAVISSGGQVRRSTLVAKGAPTDFGRNKAGLLFDGREIAVVWREVRTKPWFTPFATVESILVYRRFDVSLSPVGKREDLSTDAHVVPFDVWHATTGGIVVWDQGVRGPWGVASFVWPRSVVAMGHLSPKRFSSGQRPLALAETAGGLWAILPTRWTDPHPYRAVLIPP